MVSDSLNDSLGVFKTAYGEIGANDTIVVYGTMCYKQITPTRFDLHISCVINEHDWSTESYAILSREKICTLLGIADFRNNLYKSRVVVTNYKGVDADYLDTILGYSGLKANSSNTTPSIAIGRFYTENGDYGAWINNNNVFKVGTAFEMDLFGCTFQ